MQDSTHDRCVGHEYELSASHVVISIVSVLVNLC